MDQELPIVPTPGLTTEIVDDEAVILDAEGATVIRINSVATEIWAAIRSQGDAGMTFASVLDRLEATYPEVDRPVLAADLEELLGGLAAQQLIVDASG